MRRRDFLRQGLAAAAGAVVVGAQSPSERLARRGEPKKVIVVGAGLAGLSAAYELTEAGHDVTVLEARTRPGGRVLTLREPFSDGLYAEAGAMFIPDTHEFTLRYAKLFGLALDPFRGPGGKGVSHVRGRRVEANWGDPVELPVELSPAERSMNRDELWRKYRPPSVFKELGDPTAPGWPPPSLKKYDEISYVEFLRRNGASPGAVELLTFGTNGLWGEGLGTVSALTVLRDSWHQRGSDQWLRVRGGNDLLPKAFASRLSDRIRYGTPVVRIEHDSRGVRAVAERAGARETFAADRLVCAVPFSVLRRVEVSPPFSEGKRRAVEQLSYFSAARVSLQLRKKFWHD
ncbi:MAG TPA: FAD-dependent oxidoreductase, partial [Pyrinomonadaceae bacterium]|nr:FAD-dependent oxidoreductase [Pyrinomonadaceae bacterium]